MGLILAFSVFVLVVAVLLAIRDHECDDDDRFN